MVDLAHRGAVRDQVGPGPPRCRRPRAAGPPAARRHRGEADAELDRAQRAGGGPARSGSRRHPRSRRPPATPGPCRTCLARSTSATGSRTDSTFRPWSELLVPGGRHDVPVRPPSRASSPLEPRESPWTCGCARGVHSPPRCVGYSCGRLCWSASDAARAARTRQPSAEAPTPGRPPRRSPAASRLSSGTSGSPRRRVRRCRTSSHRRPAASRAAEDPLSGRHRATLVRFASADGTSLTGSGRRRAGRGGGSCTSIPTTVCLLPVADYLANGACARSPSICAASGCRLPWGRGERPGRRRRRGRVAELRRRGVSTVALIGFPWCWCARRLIAGTTVQPSIAAVVSGRARPTPPT